MQWLSDKIDAALAWIANLLQDIFYSLFDLVIDIVTYVLQAVLGAVVFIQNTLPAPAFLDTGLQGMFTGIEPSILYFLGQSGFTDAVALLGAGFAVRMVRKLVTLGQW